MLFSYAALLVILAFLYLALYEKTPVYKPLRKIRRRRFSMRKKAKIVNMYPMLKTKTKYVECKVCPKSKKCKSCKNTGKKQVLALAINKPKEEQTNA